MKPANLKTTHPSFRSKIFLDGGDPEETKKLIETLGFLDGQTTNPTLISKNPEAAKRLAEGQKFSKEEIFDFYKEVVKEISGLIPGGSVSVEVYADANTTAEEMFTQGKDMYTWIPNAHVKYPTTKVGLEAAEKSIKEGMKVNMTLVFSQAQAAAVYSATKGALRGQVFVSPFVGRLDDRGENGMDLVKNILKMYESSDGHVEVLTASLRNMEHLLYGLSLGSDIITAPFKLLDEWVKKKMPIPELNSYSYNSANLRPIEYKVLDLNGSWDEFDVNHALTDSGIEKFSTDWNGLIQRI
ncbi:transaldolase [Candidatus Daviesbacteria bacterium]|nr:transaldolase [Candidatus Daviesbacteria bacterium]